jgi:scyllo-inositol 2-dehydrogenase (NADP+)
MNIIRVGIVGFGRVGAEHAQRISQTSSLRVTAISDPTPERQAKAETLGLKTTESIEALIARDDVNAILVSTPTSMHFDHAALSLKAGKHVMIEKPMALDLTHARQLVDLAREKKLVLSVFHNRRWDVDFLTQKQAIDGGVFGRVLNVESRLGQYASCVGPAAVEWRPGWRNEAAFGGGGLFDWGSHFLDQIWRLMLPVARPVRVFAQLRGNVWTRDCDDFARVVVDFDNGAVGLVEINTTTMRPLPRWHVDGTHGSAFSPFSLEFDTDVWASLRFTPVEGGAHRTLPKAEAGLNPIQIWERFASAVRGEGEVAVSAESVLPTMALLDAARESSSRGVAVDVSGVDWRV